MISNTETQEIDLRSHIKTSGSYISRIITLCLLLIIGNPDSTFSQENLPRTQGDFNDDSDKIQFAIISDLWGGYRTGVFENAVQILELMQPQFTISVGDLIDGKTEDSTLLAYQWDEFNTFVSTLTMPFYYVPGNHDISNPWMEQEWNRRFGSTYYHFTYKDALFICINTQDGGFSGIQEEQINYFKEVLTDHSDVRWTFVFMHRPIWNAENSNQEGYEQIEAKLVGRDYTLFSGHKHIYAKSNKNGNEHFVLGTTGGGSKLRGLEYGEFDHITWVTLPPDEAPKIIHIELDGFIGKNLIGY